MSESGDPEEPDDGGRARPGRFRRLGRRILGEHDEGRSFFVDAKEVVGAVLEGGDKAKSEVVRAVAREVRNYLEELGLKDDLHHLVTNYSFEVRASFNLRRLDDNDTRPPAPPTGGRPPDEAGG